MSACPELSVFQTLLAGQLDDTRQDELAAHVDGCQACRQKLDDLAGRLNVPDEIRGRTDDASTRTVIAAMNNVLGSLPPWGMTMHEFDVGAQLEIPAGLLTPSDYPGSRGRLGAYEILGVVGRGGLGMVLKGFDTRLNRVVAIKLPAPELVCNPVVRKRFSREAQAAAALRHDHVVTIYSIDESIQTPFLVMEFIEGMSLQQEIDRNGPLEMRAILRIGMQTAAGLAAAHKQGLVHRDVKPANILLENGVQRVKLTDFGLARAVDDASLTQSGVVSGTPQYMSPEQARGEVVDARSDLFSLGSVFYTMCTGRAAFRADSAMAVLHRVCSDAARPIRERNPEIPEWFVEIVDRLLQKNPADRFQSAAEVADLLSQHLAYAQQPNTVPAPHRLPPVRAAAAPRRSGWPIFLLAIGLSASLLLLPCCLAGFLFSYHTLEEATPVAPVWQFHDQHDVQVTAPAVQHSVQFELGEPCELVIDGRSILISKGDHHWYAKNLPEGKHQIEFVRVVDGERRVIEQRSIDVSGHENLTVRFPSVSLRIEQYPRADPSLPIVIRTNSPAYSVAFSPDAKEFAIGTWGHGLSFVDTERWIPHAGPQDAHKFITRALYVGDNRIAATGDVGEFLVWQRPVNAAAQRFQGHKKMVWQLAASADGSRIASCSEDGKVHVWEMGRGVIAVYSDHTGNVSSVDLSPDGKRVISAGFDGKVRLRNIDGGESQEFAIPEGVLPHDVKFLDDNRAFGGSNNFVLPLWNLADMQVVRTFRGHTGMILTVAAHPSRRWIASGSSDGTVRVWDVDSGAEAKQLGGHGEKVNQVSFSPDGRYLASAASDSRVRIWKFYPALGMPETHQEAIPTGMTPAGQIPGSVVPVH